jgi:hypothetical protein
MHTLNYSEEMIFCMMMVNYCKDGSLNALNNCTTECISFSFRISRIFFGPWGFSCVSWVVLHTASVVSKFLPRGRRDTRAACLQSGGGDDITRHRLFLARADSKHFSL